LLSKFVSLPIFLAALMVIVAACGGGPTQGAAPDAPAAPAAEGGEAAAGGEGAPVLDEYQTQRLACTAESPCWPDIAETVPTSFSEAPMLAELVASGDLPPVEERLPVNPLVIEPAEMIGTHGGVLRGAFTGPGDRQNYERWINDYTIFWDAGATELRPRLAHSWESNEDATTWTFHLREGLKWSDGEPFTVDDYMFWYEYIVQNSELVPVVPWWMQWGGELAVFEKIDDYNFSITFADPFPSWPENMLPLGWRVICKGVARGAVSMRHSTI
jgi:ABC-type transport system substrate-binding protein